MGDKLLSVAQKLSNKGFYRRLSTISTANDALANDVTYQNTYLVNAKREADKMYEIFSKKYYIVEKEMTDPSRKFLDMSIMNELHRRFFLSTIDSLLKW